MGIKVDFFDHGTANRIGMEQARRVFLNIVKSGKYDTVFIATHMDEYDEESLAKARRYARVIAWNSDDEWRWESYSKGRVSWYDYMVTNSPDVYEKYKSEHDNLLHAQWACTGFWDGRNIEKDIGISFAGKVYGSRKKQLEYLRKKIKILAFGQGSKNIYQEKYHANNIIERKKNQLKQFIKTKIYQHMSLDTTLNFQAINSLWNRSRISFTPLISSDHTTLQIKSRVFDMGLSGTLMLAHRAPHLDEYYEPDKEYVPFDSMEDCVEKVKYYLRHESQRRKIAYAYAERTLAEHMWRHRIASVLQQANIK